MPTVPDRVNEKLERDDAEPVSLRCRFSRSGALESYRHRIDRVWHSYSRVGETVVANMRYAVLK